MPVDYHVHAMGHAEYRHTEADLMCFLREASRKGLCEIGFADHDYYATDFNLPLIRSLSSLFPSLNVRQGIEIDFHPERVGEIDRLIAGYPYDFVIGSVHCAGSFIFDMPDSLPGYAGRDIAELYRDYFRLVAAAACSRRFDIIGHLDVIKVFGFRPPGPVLPLAEQALSAIAASRTVVEINTNGMYKPAAEMYPSKDLLQECFDRNIPITLSSDAHAPENVGRDIALAAEQAVAVGYRRVVGFAGRKPHYIHID